VGPSRLVLRLTLEPGEPLAGSLADSTGEGALAFSGWLGLLEALEVLRSRAGHQAGPGPPGAALGWGAGGHEGQGPGGGVLRHRGDN